MRLVHGRNTLKSASDITIGVTDALTNKSSKTSGPKNNDQENDTIYIQKLLTVSVLQNAVKFIECFYFLVKRYYVGMI